MMTPQQSAHAVKVWRRTYSKVCDRWYQMEAAAKKCIKTGKRVDVGVTYFEMDGPFMKMVLPAGHALYYCRPKIRMMMAPWGEKKETITYWQLNDKNQWALTKTHGGKLVENETQAIARDLLAGGMLRADKAGLPIFLHVHDQIANLSNVKRGKENLAILVDCMSRPFKWAPGLPLAAKGTVTTHFIKD